jgi:hypothetical protein
MKIILSFLIWLLLFMPMVLISLPVVGLLLSTPWSGGSTWFGNAKYPRGHGSTHLRPDNWWGQWIYLCFRNPVSNYGHTVLSANKQYWFIDRKLVGSLWCKYGWKGTNPPYTFIFRPYLGG